MLDMIDWSEEKPNRNDLGQYVQDVQKAPQKPNLCITLAAVARTVC